MFGGWLAAIGGAWFVVGRTLASTLRLGDIGHPIATTEAKRAAIEIASFSGLGALIVFLAGAVLARMSVRTARDVEYARQAAPPSDVHTFDAFAESAQTEELTDTPRRHRREGGGGLFRRRNADATSQ